jgi:hypothetical protein
MKCAERCGYTRNGGRAPTTLGEFDNPGYPGFIIFDLGVEFRDRLQAYFGVARKQPGKW